MAAVPSSFGSASEGDHGKRGRGRPWGEGEGEGQGHFCCVMVGTLRPRTSQSFTFICIYIIWSSLHPCQVVLAGIIFYFICGNTDPAGLLGGRGTVGDEHERGDHVDGEPQQGDGVGGHPERDPLEQPGPVELQRRLEQRDAHRAVAVLLQSPQLPFFVFLIITILILGR